MENYLVEIPLSNRARREMKREKSPLSNERLDGMFGAFFADKHDFDTNPNGFMNFCIAENTLCYDLLRGKLECDPNIKQSLTQYSEFGGINTFRQAIANLLEHKIFRCESGDVDPKQIIVGSGCTSLLEALFYGLCDSGDSIIIPSPMYPSFVHDARMRANVKIEPASMTIDDGLGNIRFALRMDKFDEAWKKVEAEGGKVKAVLLCNPNNPTGQLFSSDELLELIEWCRVRQIHLISDEIYALSTFSTSNHFVSAYNVVNGRMGDNIHIISGFSKDFCLNGYRAGYIYSQNNNLVNYIKQISPFFTCSNAVQSILTNILTDKPFLSSFIHSNQARLKSAYTKTICYLKEAGIPYVESQGGMFLLLDMRCCMAEITFEEEMRVWDALYDAKVLVNPGWTFHNDHSWLEIQKDVDKRGILTFMAFTSIYDNKANVLEAFIQSLQVKPKENSRSLILTNNTVAEKSSSKKEVAPDYLIIFDDLSNELKDPSITKLMKIQRHFSTKIIISTQSWTDSSSHIRKEIYSFSTKEKYHFLYTIRNGDYRKDFNLQLEIKI
ncbi:1-aminocyclopropane-1-carboxylate synthase [Cavenderia fasciculata]|uniref:1-aminocyclopropane-1-carboxylate synthase n=1 Tax=Cavenderia fasciculata TaxID=261658 RepID=F4PGT7_CACFS|nr:1-aminocyclopropane-1-carboxylate synthase [Cavenderia fasciculata]EGG24921.1 1-aminocyclopropane-1-carboxylate synthase [Cavenderia fasciculata]|eukprot:XP_004362772.1 1-aminocyclopropane-1-carboxylate synthase [Cavenderia fasciculata]